MAALLQGIFLTQALNLSLFTSPALTRGFFNTSTTQEVPHASQENAQMWHLAQFSSVARCVHLFATCHPLLLLPPIPPSIRVFSSESALRMRRPKSWSFSFSISPSSEHPGLISFRMDCLDLLEVQGTLKSLRKSLWHWKEPINSKLQPNYVR